MSDRMQEACRRAIATWGPAEEIHQVEEEMAELLVALKHYRRGRDGGRERVIEEMADVYVTLESLRQLVDPGGKYLAAARVRKVQRLEERLQNPEAHFGPYHVPQEVRTRG